eukprot:TRINITY_DN28980_c0_g2_i1.p1 TRINITY_DN28980_c0_g2~~TRINITY_DN28980_c0_g2_i1.p1  ORF type:complete len:1746 (-),score=340.85 TRINITY_DN28980_c0_g2_i1:105-5342(-)
MRGQGGYSAGLDSPTGAACRACFSVSGLVPSSAKRLLPWRKDASNQQDKSIREFCDVMFGTEQVPSAHSLGPSLEPASGAFCLEELSAETIRAAAQKASSSWARGKAEGETFALVVRDDSGQSGFAAGLRPHLEDLLVRRQGFRAAVDLLAAAADAGELPRSLAELTPKELFVALLLVTPSLRRRVYLAAAYAALRLPLPVVFRQPVVGIAGVRELRTKHSFELLHELACVPHTTRQLVLNVGTEKVSACGKTTLLGALALVAAAETDFDVQPAGPLHGGSCDLICAESGRWLIDVHGYMPSNDEELRQAILAMKIWGGAVLLVHCALGDLHPRSGSPSKELANLLTDFGVAENAGGRGAVLLVRDASEDAFAPRRDAIEAALKPFGVVDVIPVEDFRTYRSTARRSGAAEKLRSRVLAILQRQFVGCRGTPSLEELLKIHSLVVDGQMHRPPAQPLGTRPSSSMLGAELVRLLEVAQSTGAVSSTLFPLSAIKRRLTALGRPDDSSSAQHRPPATSAAGGPLSRYELLKLEEDRAKQRAEDIQKLEHELGMAPASDAFLFFETIVASSNPLAGVAELSRYLEGWKEPRVAPLLDRQRHLLDRTGTARTKEEPASATDAGSRYELESISKELNELDFSIDSFWQELELMQAQRLQSQSHAQLGPAKACLQASLAAGQPFQILHGRPLQMAGNFLRSVLESIGAHHEADPRGIYVVSVIGAQSSAKSTLLNFLFGCGFAVSSGRCTRGLYASYFRPEGRPPMLVLDSEGLLSLGSEGSTFDGQIALMCITCSHLVLVNNKGELSRQLQDLLEICLFAMKHLRLARLQPRLAFVLRDQHDRSRTVHEDMLKTMRSHLEDAARSLGSPLQDLILMDGTAVFLLPSAVTSELRQGTEVCWTSELFSREVLQLRAEVFRWLQEDSQRRNSAQPPEFGSLAQWYDYAATVWETLDQFGQQLLHCRTIHEIEQRRELADVAKSAVREALDGVDGETHSGGFHERARQLVDSFVSRIHASPTKLDLDTTDMELCRALAHLRDDYVAKLEDLFREKAADPRFSTTAKEQARQQIRTPIEWAFENHLYTWKLHLKKASDERAMHELWVHFTGVLNRHLAGSGHRSVLSQTESQELFEAEWRLYEASFLERLKGLTKDWQTLVHEVTLLFNHAVGKLQHEAGALALLKEIGPQQLGRHGPQRCLTEQTDEEWEEQYFHVGWWNTMKMHGLALLQNAGNLDNSINMSSLRSSVIPRMRQVVQQGLQQRRMEVRGRSELDEATAADALRHIVNVVLHDLETRLLADCSATLKRPQMLHALHAALRTACAEALEDVETDKQKAAMTELLAQKTLVEEHFLLIVQANKGDVEKATNFATLYHRSLASWLDHEVTQLAAEVRSKVLQEMPDPQKSSERAFQMSFASRSWPDVLEYVLDTNAYLEKQFLIIFHQQKRSYVGAARSRVEKRVLGAYRLLQDIIGQWMRKVQETSLKGPEIDVAMGKAPTASKGSQRSVRELKDFIATHAEKIPANADSAEAHRQLAERLPATADFQVADPKLFCETLQARLGDYADSPELPQRLGVSLEKALREQSIQAWGLIRGCSERCPLCGSKCDLVGEHARHQCAHHLFPAFHGWMDRMTGLPSFNHCLCKDTLEGTYECKDGAWRKLDEYLRADHPNWLPFGSGASPAAVQKDTQLLRAAWTNIREPLLEYFSPMSDECPEEWRKDYYEEGRALGRQDLQAAKDTIRKLRLRKWSPPD